MDKDRTYLLHIETATNICSVALSANGEYVHHISESSTLQHATIITLLIERLCKEADIRLQDLSAIVLSEGPGSYTSLRVGMSVAKGLAYGMDIPLVAVNTLEAMAIEAKNQFPDADHICAMVDARRMEVYASVFDREMNKEVDNQPVILEAALFDPYLENEQQLVLCGNGTTKAKALFEGKSIIYTVSETDARFLINPGFEKYTRGDFTDMAYFSPNYIKSPNITKAKKKLL